MQSEVLNLTMATRSDSICSYWPKLFSAEAGETTNVSNIRRSSLFLNYFIGTYIYI